MIYQTALIEIVPLLALFSLAVASPIPQHQYILAEQQSFLTLMSAESKALKNLVSTQYTTAMSALSPSQQIGVIVGASLTLSIILFTIVYVIVKARRQSTIDNAKVLVRHPSEPVDELDSAFTRGQLKVLTTRPTIGTKINIFSIQDGSVNSPLTMQPSACEEMDLKMHLYEKMANANRIPTVSHGFLARSIDVIMLGESPKGAMAEIVNNRIDEGYENLLRSIQSKSTETAAADKLDNEESEEQIDTQTPSELTTVTEDSIGGEMFYSAMELRQVDSRDNLKADIATEATED